eukprot:scaffold18298_cov124-Isochrysis_galbana.AAC.1
MAMARQGVHVARTLRAGHTRKRAAGSPPLTGDGRRQRSARRVSRTSSSWTRDSSRRRAPSPCCTTTLSATASCRAAFRRYTACFVSDAPPSFPLPSLELLVRPGPLGHVVKVDRDQLKVAGELQHCPRVAGVPLDQPAPAHPVRAPDHQYCRARALGQHRLDLADAQPLNQPGRAVQPHRERACAARVGHHALFVVQRAAPQPLVHDADPDVLADPHWRVRHPGRGTPIRLRSAPIALAAAPTGVFPLRAPPPPVFWTLP